MSPRALVLLPVVAWLLGCGHGLHGIRGPDPDTPGDAHIVARSSETPGRVFASRPSIVLHAYDLHEACYSEDTLEAHYLGSLGLDRFEREFRVAGGRYLFLRVVMSSYVGFALVGCKVAGGFAPRKGGRYRLDFSAFSTRACVLDVTDAEGRPVALHAPTPC